MINEKDITSFVGCWYVQDCQISSNASPVERELVEEASQFLLHRVIKASDFRAIEIIFDGEKLSLYRIYEESQSIDEDVEIYFHDGLGNKAWLCIGKSVLVLGRIIDDLKIGDAIDTPL